MYWKQLYENNFVSCANLPRAHFPLYRTNIHGRIIPCFLTSCFLPLSLLFPSHKYSAMNSHFTLASPSPDTFARTHFPLATLFFHFTILISTGRLARATSYVVFSRCPCCFHINPMPTTSLSMFGNNFMKTTLFFNPGQTPPRSFPTLPD